MIIRNDYTDGEDIIIIAKEKKEGGRGSVIGRERRDRGRGRGSFYVIVRFYTFLIMLGLSAVFFNSNLLQPIKERYLINNNKNYVHSYSNKYNTNIKNENNEKNTTVGTIITINSDSATPLVELTAWISSQPLMKNTTTATNTNNKSSKEMKKEFPQQQQQQQHQQ